VTPATRVPVLKPVGMPQWMPGTPVLSTYALRMSKEKCVMSQTIWSVILRNFELEMVDPMPKANYDGMVVGPKPCRVRYRRRKLV